MLSLGMLLSIKLSDIAKLHPWYLKTNPSSSWSSPKTTLLHRLHLMSDQIWDSMFICAPSLILTRLKTFMCPRNYQGAHRVHRLSRKCQGVS